ncbi:MAG: ribulose-phosphate 3-epimerase [Candidatus Omnitrophica bacterium]|nr:ribulose-phosphate 3-epimerase [Candidatus Omnitrophota bacterium]
MRIIPAILTKNKEELLGMLTLCRKFTNYVQIDIMDGKFVPSKSISSQELAEIDFPINSEAHLMVVDPCFWLDSFKKFGSERIIYHYEIDKDHEKIISQIKKNGFSPGLAINPSTKINEFKALVDKVDVVLFMSVIPGFYGSEFIPAVLEKIKKFKDLFPNKRIGIDGGIKLDNLKMAVDLGIDDICVGSAILKTDDPEKSCDFFKTVINE